MSRSSPTEGSRQGELVRLDVIARDRVAEIVVIDQSLKPFAYGVGQISVELPPGIYKARVITGAQVREQFAVLKAGEGPVKVEFDPIAFASPAPLGATAKAQDDHMEAARAQSLKVHVDLGGSSEIFLFLRDLTKPGKAPAASAELAAGVKLVDAGGQLLVDFQAQGARDAGENPWYACNVALKPGIYRLVTGAGAEGLAQTVVASEGWQTQLFLMREPVGQGGDRHMLNMASASMFLAKRGQGFQPREEGFRLIELARIGLANRRKILSRADMDRLLDGKFENPLYGLFGAHLLLLARPPDRELIAKVVGNLRGMLGTQHPDVEAIALASGAPDARESFDHPPMLARSYWLVIERSAKKPWLVPPGSVMVGIAARLWSGPGSWLVYGEPGIMDAPMSFALESNSLTSNEDLIKQLRHQDLQRLTQSRIELTAVEEAVLRYLTPSSATRLSLRVLSFPLTDDTDSDEERLVRALGVPPAALHDAIRGILAKARLLGSS
ncbi:MAG TPA: hypothetical protein VNA24_24040 [Hyalangium sp.]|nr:hypothetical protein [Hyalangium sp.]